MLRLIFARYSASSENERAFSVPCLTSIRPEGRRAASRRSFTYEKPSPSVWLLPASVVFGDLKSQDRYQTQISSARPSRSRPSLAPYIARRPKLLSLPRAIASPPKPGSLDAFDLFFKPTPVCAPMSLALKTEISYLSQTFPPAACRRQAHNAQDSPAVIPKAQLQKHSVCVLALCSNKTPCSRYRISRS